MKIPTRPTYRFVNVPRHDLEQSPSALDLRGRRLSRYPRPLVDGEVWAVVDVPSGNVVHVSYLGEGVAAWVTDPADALNASRRFPEMRLDFLPRLLQGRAGDAVLWASWFPEDRFRVLPRILQGESEDAWLWVTMFPQDREQVKQSICGEAARRWALDYPKDIPLMRTRITGSSEAFRWCNNVEKTPEAREIMRHLVTEPEWAFHWAHLWPVDREHMRTNVNTPKWAYRWAIRFPDDQASMRPFVQGSPEWAYKWARDFPDDRKAMYPTIAESPMWKERWVRDLKRGKRVVDVPLGDMPETVFRRKLIESQGRPGTSRPFLVEGFHVDRNANIWCLRLSREEGFPGKWYLTWWKNNKFVDSEVRDVFLPRTYRDRFQGDALYFQVLAPAAQEWERNADPGQCSALTDTKHCGTLPCPP